MFFLTFLHKAAKEALDEKKVQNESLWWSEYLNNLTKQTKPFL